MWKLIVGLLVQLHEPACSCVCLDGIAKTECRTVEAAREEGPRCHASMRCHPELPDRPMGVPIETLKRCDEVRVWRPIWQAYDGVRVCDVRYGVRHNALEIPNAHKLG